MSIEPARNITLIKANVLLSTYSTPGAVSSGSPFLFVLLYCFHSTLTPSIVHRYPHLTEEEETETDRGQVIPSRSHG